MKIIIIILGILAIFATTYFLTRNKKKPVKIVDNFKPIYITYNADQKELLDIINTHRMELGMQELRACKSLTDAAKIHCEYMFKLKKANHINGLKRKRDFIAMGFVEYSEIVTEEYTSNQTMMRAYLKSIAHKQTIETPEFNCVGLYSIRDEDEIYNVIIFTQY